MPPIYFKTIGLVISAVCMGLLRVNQFIQFFLFSTPEYIGPVSIGLVLDSGIIICGVAIFVNEKFSKGERWNLPMYALFGILVVLLGAIRLSL
jgi:hypothetical protein